MKTDLHAAKDEWGYDARLELLQHLLAVLVQHRLAVAEIDESHLQIPHSQVQIPAIIQSSPLTVERVLS